MSEVSSEPSTHLEPPSKTIELEDSGAPESGMCSREPLKYLYSMVDMAFKYDSFQ